MNALQHQRLNQLIDKLLDKNISRYEYMEYRALWSSIGKEVINSQRSLNLQKKHIKKSSSPKYLRPVVY